MASIQVFPFSQTSSIQDDADDSNDPSSFSTDLSSSLPPSLLRFGNTHSWSLERWRNRAVQRRKREIQHEMEFLECLELIAQLSEVREKETALIGAARFSPPHRESYSSIHGHYESERLRLQRRLDQLKVKLDPTYAGKFVRHHQLILELAQLERNVDAAVEAGDKQAAELAIQLSLLKQSGALHSTHKSASASATPGGLEHRIPNSIWLANSIPSSALLTVSLDGDSQQRSSSSSAESVSLRMRRLRKLVQLENRFTLAQEQYAALLTDLRALQAEHLSLQDWRLHSERSAAETTKLHAELTLRLERELAQEKERGNKAEGERERARAEILVRDVEIARLRNELSALGYTAKQLGDKYAQYVTNKVSSQDAPQQTEEGVTGLGQGGWIDEYGTCPPPEPITVGVQLTDEELAALTVAGLVKGAVAAQALLNQANGVSGAPSNEQTPGASPVLSSQPAPSASSSASGAVNGSPKKTKRAARMSSGGGGSKHVISASASSLSSTPSLSTDASSRRSSNGLSIPNSPTGRNLSSALSGSSSAAASAGSRRSQSVGMGSLADTTANEKARRAAAVNESKSMGGNEQLLTLTEEAS